MIDFHWRELKYRFGYCVLTYVMVCLIVWSYKFNILNGITDLYLMFTSLTEAFYAYVYLTLLLSLLFTIPFIVYSYTLFLIPGVYWFEFKEYLIKLTGFITLLILSYKVGFDWLLSVVISFLLGFESSDVVLNLKITDFVSFYSWFTLGFIMLVSLPMFKIELAGKRRMVYMGLMVLLALVTPPDVLSLVVCWLLLVFLFELFYLIGKFHR